MKAEFKPGWVSLPRDTGGVTILPGDTVYSLDSCKHSVKRIALEINDSWTVFDDSFCHHAPESLTHERITWDTLQNDLEDLLSLGEIEDVRGEAAGFMDRVRTFAGKSSE